MTPCASGFYCPEGSEEPTLCPPHTVAAAPRAKQQEDCEPCPLGAGAKLVRHPYSSPKGAGPDKGIGGSPWGSRRRMERAQSLLSRRSSHPRLPCWPLLPWREEDPCRSPQACSEHTYLAEEGGQIEQSATLPRWAPLPIPRGDAASRPKVRAWRGEAMQHPLFA